MLSHLHTHVVSELQQSSRTDTVFVVTAVLFNLVVLGINWGVAAASHGPDRDATKDLILAVLVVATVLINFFCLRALQAGRHTRAKLTGGLIALYKDQAIDRYYDPQLLDAYGARNKLFVAVLVVLAVIATVVPLLERLGG
ncbi:MAG: hypothetical protein MUE60_02705 [Candidatus Eisenbacteria bacterium]|jgi:uncharacterized membrane protein (UPF0136 family)|nr:hypothetical protein [Candidatus Eisenbacteria bacterium]